MKLNEKITKLRKEKGLSQEFQVEKIKKENNNFDLAELDTIITSNKLKEYIEKVHKRYSKGNMYIIIFPAILGILMIISAFLQNLKPQYINSTLSFILFLVVIFGIIIAILKLQERNGKKRLLNSFNKSEWQEISTQIENTDNAETIENSKNTILFVRLDAATLSDKYPQVLEFDSPDT